MVHLMQCLGLLLALAAPLAAGPQGGDGNDTCDTAQAIGPGTYPGLVTSSQWTFPVAITFDYDWYRLSVLPGQRIDVDAVVTQVNPPTPPATYYTSLQVFEFSPVVCQGPLVASSFTNHIAIENTGTTVRDLRLQYHAGTTDVGSVVVAYDLAVQASTVSTGVSYCPGAPNSTGLSAILLAQGTNSVSANNLSFLGLRLPLSIALLATGTSQTNVPFGDGTRCIAGAVNRLVLHPVAAGGSWSATLDLGSLPPGAGVVPGDVRYYQLYYRDVFGPLGSGFNLSNGVCVGFTP